MAAFNEEFLLHNFESPVGMGDTGTGQNTRAMNITKTDDSGTVIWYRVCFIQENPALSIPGRPYTEHNCSLQFFRIDFAPGRKSMLWPPVPQTLSTHFPHLNSPFHIVSKTKDI